MGVVSAPPKLPIIILTGFLGSGKTTLLNALLRLPSFTDTAVVVNEFGAIGLDHLLVQSANENVVLLDAGCLCCTVIDSLKETLADLYHRRARGTLPAFGRIIIETTGLADPCPVLQQLMSDSLLAHLFTLHSLVCIVDALFGASQLEVHTEARVQAAMADRLWITKTDLTDDRVPADLIDRLSALNPHADCQVLRPDTDLAGILGGANVNPIPFPNLYARTPQHDASIGSHSFWILEPVTWVGVAAWIGWLKESCGPRLLRCKGLLNVQGARGPVIVHGVRTLFKTSVLPEWPAFEPRLGVVVIGRDIQRQLLQAGLETLRRPDIEASPA
jgi:G3E family GTPase